MHACTMLVGRWTDGRASGGGGGEGEGERERESPLKPVSACPSRNNALQLQPCKAWCDAVRAEQTRPRVESKTRADDMCMHVCMYVCICIYIYRYRYICLSDCCLSVGMYAKMSRYVCIKETYYTHTHPHTRTHTHANIYISIFSLLEMFIPVVP